MSKKSLASLLKRQWWLHTTLTSMFFISVLFFSLFIFEDYLNERQLIDISNMVAVNEPLDGMPPHIQKYSIDDIPKPWMKKLEGVAFNKTIEIDDHQGVPFHLLRSQFTDSKTEFVLALDTSKTHSVWSLSDELLIFLLPWVVIFLAIVSILVNKFIGHIHFNFNRLIATINQSDSPDELRLFAESQDINELAQFAQLIAQEWQLKTDILAREKQGLQYLSHELRTPIQSSLATLELLALKTTDQQTITRLTRSLNRMTRLSNSILHLMESVKSLPTYQVDVISICQHLIDELKPLTEIKKQSISIHITESCTHEFGQPNEQGELQNSPVKIVATQEVMETLLSILLTNALQHGNSSPILITITPYEIKIENEVNELTQLNHSKAAKENQQGFGIGLTIAHRLANKFNLKLDVSITTNHKVIATVSNK